MHNRQIIKLCIIDSVIRSRGKRRVWGGRDRRSPNNYNITIAIMSALGCWDVPVGTRGWGEGRELPSPAGLSGNKGKFPTGMAVRSCSCKKNRSFPKDVEEKGHSGQREQQIQRSRGGNY